MNKAFKNLLFYIAVFIIVDSLAGVVLYHSFAKINYGTIGIINASLKTDTEIIILGSSRAMHHYDPNVIYNETGLSCINAGLGGYGLFYNYSILDEIVKVHKPKIVILDLSPNVINDPKSYEKLNLFMPYASKYSSFNELMQINPNYHYISRFSYLYRYNSTLYDYVRSGIGKPKSKNGFIGLNGLIDTTNFNPTYCDQTKIDTNKIAFFKKTIKICKKNNIRLVCIISPTFIKYDINNEIIGVFNNIAKKNGIEFLDDSSITPFYKNKEYFSDQLHMNKQGAELYSGLIGYYLSK